MFLNTQLEHGVLVSPMFGLCIDESSTLFNLNATEIGEFILNAKATINYVYDVEAITQQTDPQKPLWRCGINREDNPRLFLAMEGINENPYASDALKRWCNNAVSEYDKYFSSRRAPDKRTRKKIIERDKSFCRYCGEDATGRIHIDHVTPYSLNGLTVIENLVVACRTCNLRKNGKTLQEAGMKLL